MSKRLLKRQGLMKRQGLPIVVVWACGFSFERSAAGESVNASEPLMTMNGCTCKESWVEEGIGSCDSYCCNPDSDPAGSWCLVADVFCEDSDWGYCREGAPLNTPGSGVDGCDDVDGWRDSDGDTCTSYRLDEWCDRNGQPGLGWHEEWGSFSSFAANGYTAATACCICGGGSTGVGAGSSPTSDADARYTFNDCKCRQHWEEDLLGQCNNYCCDPDNDPAGDWCLVEDTNCEDSDWGYCRSGVGLPSPTPPPSTPAQIGVHGHCTDTPNWKDSDGDDCNSYAMNNWCTDVGGYGLGWHEEWGTFATFAAEGVGCSCRSGSSCTMEAYHTLWCYVDAGVCTDQVLGEGGYWSELSCQATALENCCSCGGGTRDDQAPRPGWGTEPLPSADDKVRYTWSGCACKEHWEEVGLGRCDSYCCNPDFDTLGDWCLVADIMCEESDWGYCRSSGIGTVGTGRNDRDHCEDERNWKDKDGDNCEIYAMDKWCDGNGNPGPGWNADWGTFETFINEGKTAKTACCACGGGTDKPPMEEEQSDKMWRVVYGPCKEDSIGCITSGNYPNWYSANEHCEISVNPAQAKPIQVISFDTEALFDELMVNSRSYSGKVGPDGVLPYGSIYWGADLDSHAPGWKICPRGAVPPPSPSPPVGDYGGQTVGGSGGSIGNTEAQTPAPEVHEEKESTDENLDEEAEGGIILKTVFGLLAVVALVVFGLWYRAKRMRSQGNSKDGIGAGPVSIGKGLAHKRYESFDGEDDQA